MEDKLIYFGDEIKAIGNTVQGYLVRFGKPDDTDLEGDYFTKNTDFGRPLKEGQKFALNLYYHHGQDNVIGTKSIGTGFVKMDNVGLWYEAQVEMNDVYNTMIMELAKAGKLGFSSGAAAHMVERKSFGSSSEILRWNLAEASLTPRPAEYRNMVSAKMLNEMSEEVKAKPEDLKVGDYVQWMAYGTDVKGKIIAISYSETLVGEPLGTEMTGSEENPVFKIAVYQRQNDGTYKIGDATTVHRAEALSKIDKPYKDVIVVCPECGEDMVEEEDGMECKACGYKPPKKSYTPHRPMDIRDAEKTLREAMCLSRSEAKKLANILWHNLCEAESVEEPIVETKTVEEQEIVIENNNVKQMLLKKAMLDLIED